MNKENDHSMKKKKTNIQVKTLINAVKRSWFAIYSIHFEGSQFKLKNDRGISYAIFSKIISVCSQINAVFEMNTEKWIWI